MPRHTEPLSGQRPEVPPWRTYDGAVPGLITRLRGTVDVLYRELVKFGIVGAVSFVVDMGVFNLLLHVVWGGQRNVGPVSTAVAATIVSTALSSAVAWIGNRLWTFRHRRNRPAHHEAGLFALTNIVALVIGALCVAFSNKVLGLEGSAVAANVAKLVGIGLGTIFRFWAYRRFVFAGTDAGVEIIDDIPVIPAEAVTADAVPAEAVAVDPGGVGAHPGGVGAAEDVSGRQPR